ncbi:MAG: PepSY domain-containing protein [Candidatus Eremiobacteraeota bacterium]|nr:PepSY domain-containing protein [Candidatus Eremiobacteraeota bacterium]
MRPLIFVVHKYLGLFVGVYLLVICATGAVLILLENRIDNFLDYPVVHVEPRAHTQSLQKMLQTVQHAYPHQSVSHILKSCERGCTYDVSVSRPNDDRIDVLVDPYTAKIVQSSVWSTTPIGFMYAFHANLFAGETGSHLNSYISLAAVLMVACGFYLWPGWRNVRNSFSVKWNASTWRVNFDIHKIIGFTCALFFVYIIVTGIATVLISEPTPTASPAPNVKSLRPALGLDMLVSIADRALPGRTTMVYPPATPIAPLRVRKVVPGDPDPYGWSYVSVDQRSGAVIEREDSTRWPLWWRTYTYFYPLHIGSIGGYPLRFLYVVLALAPTVLYFTGFLMWLDRLRRDEHVVLARSGNASAHRSI